MVFPYLGASNWELGTALDGFWDSEVDTNAKLNVRHYTELFASPVREVPFRGAYCPQINLALGTADAYLEEAITIGLAARRFVRFYVYVQGLTMAASDRFTLFQFQSAGPTSEVVVDVRNNAGNLEILAAETGAAGAPNIRNADLVQGQWHCVELDVTIDAGVGNDGIIRLFLDGQQVGTDLGGLDQAAITQMRLGTMGIDAGTTAGHVLFDEFVVDDGTTRIGTLDRYEVTRLMTQSGHIFLGQGQIEEAYVYDGDSADSTLELYDTDTADTLQPLILPRLRLTSADRIGDKWLSMGTFKRGCYASLGGTNTRAWITARIANHSVAAIQLHAARRR